MSSVAPAATAPPARLAVLEILGEPDYRRLWLSGLFVNAARWMDLVVLGWLSYQLTGSPFLVGLAAFARSAPMMALVGVITLIAVRKWVVLLRNLKG